MKNLFMVLCVFAVVAYATDYVFEVEETYSPQYFQDAMGMDCNDDNQTVSVSCGDWIRTYSYSGFSSVEGFYNGPSEGVVVPDDFGTDYVFISNIYNSYDMKLSLTESNYDWADNMTNHGFGMDMSDFYDIWEVDGSGMLYHMELDEDSLIAVESFDLAAVTPGGLSSVRGFAYIPYLGSPYLFKYVIVTELNGSMHLYNDAGSSFVYEAEIENPVAGVSESRGITFSYNYQTFYWCYEKSGTVYVAKMYLVEGSALEQTTWGAVKAAR